MEQKSFEHKIQKKFEGYQPTPPAHVWQNILFELKQQEKNKNIAGKFRRHKTLVAAVAAGIAAAALILFYLFNYSNPSHNNTLPEKSQITEDSSNNTPSETGNHKDRINKETKTVFSNEDSSKNNTDDGSVQQKNNNTNNSGQSKDTLKKDEEHNEQNPGGLPIDKNKYIRERSAGNLTMLTPYSLRQHHGHHNKMTLHKRLSFLDNNHLAETKEQGFSKVSSGHGKWSFGLYATPELLMTKTPAANTHPNYSADFAAIYSMKNFFIQSGMSYLSGNNNTDVDVDYLKYNFLGSYEDVYEVTFDSTENGVEPTYHTKTVEVYDTLQKQTSSHFKNEYRYLNIPLLIGYGHQISPRFSVSLKGGPILSLMLKDNRKVGFNQPNTDITNMTAPEPMAKTNWQALFSAGLEYHVSSTIRFALEPRIKYYFNPVYNLDNTIKNEKPYSIGIRTGVVIDF